MIVLCLFLALSQVQWWSADSLVVLRTSGSLVIASVSEGNIDQISECEMITPYSRIASTLQNSVLILEVNERHCL